MIKTIWKHTINVAEEIAELDMPVGAKLLHVGCQKPGTVALWVEQEASHRDVETVKRHFFVYGTGDWIDDRHEYVGTCVDGVFIWHLYEAKP